MEQIQLNAKDQQVADVLVEAALSHRCISFTEIWEHTGVGRGQIGKRLSAIGRRCQQLKLPIITVLVVYKGTNRVGKGYVEFEPNFPKHPELAEAEKERVWTNKEWDFLSLVVELDGVWSDSVREGMPTRIERMVPLRNGTLRKKCLEQKGCVCAVCGFDPQKAFGEGFEQMIEVHHLYPVANGEREVTVDDLIPVCANCHRALHAKSKTVPYTSEELNKLRQSK